jgi:alcohol oxidase
MAPKEGNSIVKHGVLDERLNVHGVKHLKVADLSICPDNVGCNTCKSPAIRQIRIRKLIYERLNRAPDWREMCNASCRRSWV